jgi:hypothetical protein
MDSVESRCYETQLQLSCNRAARVSKVTEAMQLVLRPDIVKAVQSVARGGQGGADGLPVILYSDYIYLFGQDAVKLCLYQPSGTLLH